MNTLPMSLSRLLTSMCALSCCLVGLAPAQDTWTIEGEQPYFAGLTLTAANLVNMTPHGGDGERTLIIRHRIKDAFEWTCYKLPQLKVLSSFPEPANWNWENHAFGTKYASSLYAGQLITIDLTTGQPLKTVAVPMPGYIQILFDKALVVESGLVFALPSLQPVANHPLVNKAYCPFESDLHFDLPREQRPTWRLDANRWVVDGLVYGPDLKPELFLGKYSYRSDSGRHRGFRAETTRQRESARMKILMNEKTLAEAVCPKTDYYGIIHGFEPFGNGWLAVDREALVFFEQKPGAVLPNTWADRKTFPIMVPPLLTFDGEFQAVQWIGGNMTNCELGNAYVAGLESKVEGDQFMVRVSASQFMKQFPHGSALIQKIEMESGVGPQATWDQVIAGYKARNMHWIAPYAAAMKVRFSGIPVELPCPLTYYKQSDRAVTAWTSIILDVPPEEIEPYRTRDLPPAKSQQASVPSDRDQLHRLATALTSQKETIEPPPAPAPVTLPPLPPTFDPSTVQGKFSWVVPAHATRLKLMPLRLMLSALTILLAVWFIHSFFPSVQFVGNKWLTVILMVIACDFFDTGFVFLVDLFTQDPQKEFGLFDVLQMVLMYAVYLPFALFVHFKSLQANWTRIVAVYITATLIYLVIWLTIVSLVLSVTFALSRLAQ